MSTREQNNAESIINVMYLCPVCIEYNNCLIQSTYDNIGFLTQSLTVIVDCKEYKNVYTDNGGF